MLVKVPGDEEAIEVALRESATLSEAREDGGVSWARTRRSA